MTQGIACRTWEPLWADEFMQYSYDRGVFEGAAILHGLIGMGLAIRDIYGIEACPECGRASGSWVGQTKYPYRRCCFACHRANPDRSADR